MNAFAYTSNLHPAAAPVRNRLATLFALAARLADGLRSHGPASPETFVHARVNREAHRAGFGALASTDSREGATDLVEPSTAELLQRLAALSENIRRARERYGKGAL